MQRLFGQYLEQDEEEIYHDLQLLVEKLAQAHPPMMKDRTALFNVIKGGIAYGLEEAPRNVLFLEVAVMTLASKFTAEQKNKIHQVLQEKMSAAGLAADEDHEDWNSYFALEKQLLEKQQELLQAFKQFDLDGDGTVTPAEFRQGLTRCDVDVHKANLLKMVALLSDSRDADPRSAARAEALLDLASAALRRFACLRIADFSWRLLRTSEAWHTHAPPPHSHRR